MSSGILENDNLFVVGNRAWHGLGRVLENPPTTEDAIVASGLNWNVKQERLVTESGIEVPNLYANIREDTSSILGTVTKKYKIVQNLEAFSFLDNIIGQKETHFESAGSLYNGKKVWMLARMEDRKVLGDDVESYLCFSNSHDGKSSIKCFCTNVRICCANTLQLALNTTKRSWSVRHIGSLEEKRFEAIETLGLATDYFNSFDKKAEEMYVIKPNWNKFIDELIPPKQEGLSERELKNVLYIRDSITDIYNNKDDLQNIKGTGWGMYNAVADYVSNAPALRNAPTLKERKFDQLFMGEVNLLKKAEELLMVA